MSLNNNPVSSGRTVGMDHDSKKWFMDLSAGEIGWEELLNMERAGGSARDGKLPIDWILSAPKTVPFSRFMASYLAYHFREQLVFPLTEKGVRDYVSGVYEEMGRYKKKRERMQSLFELALQSFAQNGCAAQAAGSVYGGPEENAEIWTAQKLYEKLFASTSIRLPEFIAIAFGLNMSLEDVDLFLQKALLRGKLDVCSETELLLHLTFAIRRENKRSLFHKLLRSYLAAVPEKNGAAAPEERVTDFVNSGVRSFVNRCNSAPASDAAFERELDGFFARCKTGLLTVQPKNRSRAIRFWGLLEEFRKNESEAITDFKTRHQGDVFAHGKITVFVRGNETVHIPAGTLWSTEQVSPVPSKSVCDPRICVSEADCTIDAAGDDEEIAIPVVSADPGGGEIEGKQEFCCELPALKGVPFYNKQKFKRNKKSAGEIGGNVFLRRKDRGECAEIPEGVEFRAGEKRYLSAAAVKLARSGLVPIRATAPNTAFTKNSIQYLLSAFPGRDQLESFHSSALCVREEAENPDKKENKTDKSAHADLSAFLYEYGAHILENFYHERAVFGKDILRDFDENKTAAELCDLLRGTALYPSVLSAIRRRYGAEPLGRDALSASDGSQASPGIVWEDSDGLITRNRLLTAAFLAVGSRNVLDREGCNRPAQEILAESVAEINEELRSAGFHELYLPNPFDCLIAYLTMCGDPIDAYRTLFDLASDYHKKEKRAKRERKDGTKK